MMRFSIITPSCNMLNYLKRCVASVNDQEGVVKEHIIVDCGSNDGTVQWLKKNFTEGNFISENDSGMYDAINKGIKICSGDFVAYLNCDEQYLPHTLKKVLEYSEKIPDADVFHGNMLVVNNDGELKSFKKSIKARFNYLKYSSSYIYSCATFFRRNLFEEYQFNSNLKSLGDIDLYLKLLNSGKKFVHIDDYLGVFTRTANNLSSDPVYANEYDSIPLSRYGKNSIVGSIYNFLKRIEKVSNGAYYQRFPFYFQIYRASETKKRENIEARKVSFRIKNKPKDN